MDRLLSAAVVALPENAALGTLLTLFAGSHLDRRTGVEVNTFLNSYTVIQTATDASFFAIGLPRTNLNTAGCSLRYSRPARSIGLRLRQE